MIDRVMKRLKSSSISTLMILIPVLSSIYCCSHKPHHLSILTSPPMSQTSTSAYPNVEAIYESDRELVLVVTWAQVPKSEDHTMKWEIYSSKGERIYEAVRENIPIRTNMFWYERIDLGGGIRDRLMPGLYTVKLYIDDKLALSKSFQYDDRSIINRNVQRAVILPFRDVSIETNMLQNSINAYLNTIANAIYFEVKRIIPDTIPHYVAHQKIGQPLRPDCFHDSECLSLVEDLFGKSIFVTGDVEFGKYVTDNNRLTVHIYDSNRGEIKEYSDDEMGLTFYSETVHNLLVGVMREKGLLDYLASY